MPVPIITLTTDFGAKDPFVGLMKGVIFGIAPEARIVDLCHEVPPQDLLAGALMVESVLGVFPAGSIHVAVVDPGVGGVRAPLAVRTEAGFFVGPDNGLFSAVLARQSLRQAVRLNNDRYHRRPASSTFHGRDIFAPVAAHLAKGVKLTELGDPVAKPFTFDLPTPVETSEGLELHVLHVDRFGNLITDLVAEPASRLNPRASLKIKEVTIRGIHGTFGDVPIGQPVAYIGSGNRLEIAIRNGNAAATFGLGPSAKVILRQD